MTTPDFAVPAPVVAAALLPGLLQLLLLLSLLLPLLLLLMLLLLLSVEAIVWLSRCLEALSSRHSGSGAPLSAGTPDRNMQSLFVNGVV